MRFPRPKPKLLRNPIVWNRAKYRWQDRKTPYLLCTYQVEQGELAERRLRQPGWLLERIAMRPLVVKWWERKVVK